jgi:hypothetical protein
MLADFSDVMTPFLLLINHILYLAFHATAAIEAFGAHNGTISGAARLDGLRYPVQPDLLADWSADF